MFIQARIMRYLSKPNKSLKRLIILQSLLLSISVLGFGQIDHYLAGRAFMDAGKWDSARYHLVEAVEQDPGSTELHYQLGITYFTLNRIPEARDAFYEAEKRRKGLGSFYLAKSEVRLNHQQQALKYLRIHLSSRYKKNEAEILLDEDIGTLAGTSGWQQLWNEKNWYNSRDKMFHDAMFLRDQGDYLEAINQLNTLEKQGYKKSMVLGEKAAIYEELGNVKAARSSLRSAVKSDARNLDAIEHLARIQIEDGDAVEAVEGLNRVIRMDPARFEAYLLRADGLSQMGDLAAAVADLDLYLSYFPENDSAFYRKGLIQLDHGRYLDAIQSFNKALSINKGKAEYYFARGRTYAATGTTIYAEKDMSMALDLDPLNGEIWFEKGKLAEKLGTRENACYCYQKAFQYGIYEAGELLNQRCN